MQEENSTQRERLFQEKGGKKEEEKEQRRKRETTERKTELVREQKTEIERRKELIKRKEKELQEELSQEEKDTVDNILKKAKESSLMTGTPSNEIIADRLVKVVTEGGQKLKHVLRALRQFGDPSLFDDFRDKLTEDQNWRRLEELGEI